MSFEIQQHVEVTQVETRQDPALGIMRWGTNNSFPQTLKNLVEQSPTGKPSVNRTAQFYKGAGFEGEDMVVNPNGLTLGMLVDILADDLALYGAFAIHCNYNLINQPVTINPLRVAELRFNEFDELNYASMVGYHPNFARNSEVKKTIADTVTKEKIKWFNRFNPEASFSQIQKTGGGINDYLGQVLYYSGSGHSSYPIPKLQAPINYVLADIENSILMRKETSTGFINAYLLKTSMDSEDPTLEALEGAIEDSQGARGSGRVITMSGLAPEELNSTTLEPIVSGNGAGTIVDSVTSAYELTGKVISGAYLIPPILAGIDQSNGFSGTDLEDAYFVFNAITQGGRTTIERELGRVLKASVFPLDRIKIKKLTLDNEEETVIESNFNPEDPFSNAMRNLTGRQHQQLNKVARDYSKERITYSQAKIKLMSSYGFTEEMVDEWLGVKKEEGDV